MNERNKWRLFVLIFGAWLLGFLLGAELATQDARDHGFNVPHLWQPYKREQPK